MKCKLSNQKIFDVVYRGLKSQGFERSLLSDGVTCAYRGYGGAKCAAGWLIPDELYKEEYEGSTIDNSVDLENYFGRKLEFVMELQTIHDDYETADDMQARLRTFAKHYELKIPE